ncbi:MAG: S8 family peptidase [Acidobacteria bacterium]|nr:S8 family peptidase [Acidobacteriota bacterium]
MRATLTGHEIRELARADSAAAPDKRAIFRIWPDFRVRPLIDSSISTVKADAAQRMFAADGRSIVWAVIDSGIDKDHVHFTEFNNLDLTGASPVVHRDFTGGTSPLTDEFGHGTHVAGIIAGGFTTPPAACQPTAVRKVRAPTGAVSDVASPIRTITGMAPACKLVSLKVLDKSGSGSVSRIIEALDYVAQVNDNGRTFKIHGVNMSVGYEFQPEWFACGHSPLCQAVDLLVRSGVVVVVAAGNTGYGWQKAQARTTAAGLLMTINDPGNAERAITVGATHRDSPHSYGVSYFSSKGPTGDGRLKPDLVAPGERILSCASGKGAPGPAAGYVEDTGTSMAAPHVSGIIAGFLSVRREFVGRADDVKRIFVSNATDLKRERYFQGAGLADLMRAIQSV